MAVSDQVITDTHALYCGDALEVLPTFPAGAIHLSLYSPPFAGLYVYSSSDRDVSNARTYDEFREHYGLIIRELYRVTMPGRVSAVHAMDIPTSNTGSGDGMRDFPGDVIRWHEAEGWRFFGRRFVWKEPLTVRNRTMMKALAHKTIVEDAVQSGLASADQVLFFRKRGENPIPVAYPDGFLEYAGENEIPHELLSYRGMTGDQKLNRYSHWIWRQYASSHWLDVRLDRVLQFKQARDEEDEKHVHPLQLDVVDRCVALYSNPGETVLTPFAGVGSEVYGAVCAGRRGIGMELKESYYRQAVRNMAGAKVREGDQPTLPLAVAE